MLGSTATLEDAVAKASEVIQAGDVAKVKAALNDVGAPKVTQLKGDQIAAFIAALEA